MFLGFSIHAWITIATEPHHPRCKHLNRQYRLPVDAPAVVYLRWLCLPSVAVFTSGGCSFLLFTLYYVSDRQHCCRFSVCLLQGDTIARFSFSPHRWRFFCTFYSTFVVIF